MKAVAIVFRKFVRNLTTDWFNRTIVPSRKPHVARRKDAWTVHCDLRPEACDLKPATYMIKLLHLADLHIGMENYGRLDPTSGMHTRLIDYLNRLDEAIDYGLAEGADMVL